MYFSVFLVLRPPDVLCLPPLIVSKWRGLRELVPLQRQVGVVVLLPQRARHRVRSLARKGQGVVVRPDERASHRVLPGGQGRREVEAATFIRRLAGNDLERFR